MTQSSIRDLLSMLRCPDCEEEDLSVNAGAVPGVGDFDSLHCGKCGSVFPIVRGRPVMLRRDNAVFPLDAYRSAAPGRPAGRLRRLARFIPDPSINLAGKRVLARLRAILANEIAAKVLVVGGGKQRDWLDQQIGASSELKVIYSDIDSDANVDIFCDGHDLPFVSGIFDAVIATVVLEHVLYPERVVEELRRVLKPGGLAYSEVPFMQQVHEGAYDFTRYSLSGHRRLFNGFSEIESGMVAGPATSLVWAIENFALAFVSRSGPRLATKAIVRLTLAWIKHIDRLLENRPEAMDGASCTFFLGAKRDGLVADAEIISRYVGAKHLQHV